MNILEFKSQMAHIFSHGDTTFYFLICVWEEAISCEIRKGTMRKKK